MPKLEDSLRFANPGSHLRKETAQSIGLDICSGAGRCLSSASGAGAEHLPCGFFLRDVPTQERPRGHRRQSINGLAEHHALPVHLPAPPQTSAAETAHCQHPSNDGVQHQHQQEDEDDDRVAHKPQQADAREEHLQPTEESQKGAESFERRDSAAGGCALLGLSRALSIALLRNHAVWGDFAFQTIDQGVERHDQGWTEKVQERQESRLFLCSAPPGFFWGECTR